MHLATIGDFFIYNATVLVVASMICYVLAWRGKEVLRKPARIMFIGSASFLLGACVTLMYLIVTHDFSVAYVASYSSLDLSSEYVVAAFWGGQEGTFLLWLFYLGIAGVVLIYTAGKRYESGVLFYLGLVMLSILAIIIKKSPFELLPFTPVDGNGLNPLLQNYWMVIHPPTMFVGFAIAAIPFVFALTALTQRSFDDWAERSRRWTLVAWLALGVALIEGGYWAYETLGWGGFWAWDPVENSSLVPWIFLGAQIHATFIRQHRGGMHRFSLFVVCLTFLSVLYGTFLTRSGVLADFSVHSFVDLGINNFLISGLVFFCALTAVLFAWRWRDIKSASSFSTVMSRSYLVTLGVVIVFLGGVLTLLGTSAPLLTRFTDTPAAVEMSYYQVTMNPIAIIILLLLSLFPTFKWESGVQRVWTLVVAGALAFFTYLVLFIFVGISNQAYLLILSLAVSAAWSNGFLLIRRSKRNYLASPYLIHIGLAMALAGATVSAGMDETIKVSMPMGHTVQSAGYELTFVDIERVGNKEFQHIEITDMLSGKSFVATTESRFQVKDNSVMRIPHVEKYFFYDIYVAPVHVETIPGDDPGLIELSKGDTAMIGDYQIWFEGFEVSGHGEGGGMNMAAANLTITRGSIVESVSPYMELHENELHPVGVMFANDSAEVFVANINAENGSVLLKFFGDFVPEPTSAPESTMIAEISVKPMINFFWMGTILIFVGGAFSIGQGGSSRRKKPAAPQQVTTRPELSRASSAG